MYLGLDLGTTGLRGILVDSSGHVIGDSTVEILTKTPKPGWSEQSPLDWIDACKKVIKQLRAVHHSAFSSLRGIGLSGHMHGATLIDENNNVLRPCILWNDTRSLIEANELDQLQEMRTITGNIVFPGFTAPKLLWVRKFEPHIFNQIAKVLLPKDYLRLWLTGDYISDYSDSAGTSWLNVKTRQWSPTALEISHMRMNQMPCLVEGSELGGELKNDLRQKWGLPNRVVVAGGAGDNAAAACGIGSVDDGTGFISLGTSGVLLVAREEYAPAPQTAVHCFCHAIPNKWIQMGVILSATNSLNWLSRNLNQPVEALNAKLPDEINGPSLAKFLPYLSGERTPHNDSLIRGAFLNLDITSEPTDLTQAVMEGVAFAMRDCLEALRKTGTSPNKLIAVGGGAQSNHWLKSLATILDLPLELPKGSEFGAAIGAARLAICADGVATPLEIMTSPEIEMTIEPRKELSERYETEYQRFKNYYSVLAPLSKERINQASM